MNQKSNETQQNGAELVVRMLEAQGVTHVFGIPGAKIDAVFNALVDSKIQTVVCRHEQNAAFIAGGIGRMTGKAGVAIATSGPGVSNLVAGLATANSEGDPIVALGGAVATSETLKQLHQTMDAVSICKPVTKFSATVASSDMVGEVMANAFRAAESGRPMLLPFGSSLEKATFQWSVLFKQPARSPLIFSRISVVESGSWRISLVTGFSTPLMS
jgi:acetolactate synthase I/II/III large subunit